VVRHPPRTREGGGSLTLELDIVGHDISLSERDADLLLAGAEAGSGSSIGCRDLATRLKDLALRSPQLRRRLVLSRPESRALQRLLEAQFDPDDRLLDLRQTLAEVLGRSGGLPATLSGTREETLP
jgi:hypothetical protein